MRPTLASLPFAARLLAPVIALGLLGGALVAVALLAAAPKAEGAAGDVLGVELQLLGQTNLPSPGHDGLTKARGQNGDVAVIGNTAFVAGGALFHGAQSTPGRICTDYGGVKVVDISNPASPVNRTPIRIDDYKGIVSGPRGNNRRGKQVANVSSSASSLDVIHNPVTNTDILAIATQRCEQSFFDGGRIEFWDVSDPQSPKRVGAFDPQNVANPLCDPGPPINCPFGVSPADGRSGIFEDVRMFTRPDRPGKVYAVATTPFSSNSQMASFVGEMKLLDVTNPENPVLVDGFPDRNIGIDTSNGCRNISGGRAAAPTPDGRQAILSWYDGAQPANAPLDPTTLGGPSSAALFQLNLDNLPKSGGSNVFAPNPRTWGYPVGTAGGETPAGRIEGNAADVQPFLGSGGRLMSFVSEDDVDPAVTNFSLTAPASAAISQRACVTLIGKKPHELPGQQLAGEVAYVGRGCPASSLEKDTLPEADPYLADPNGKIALLESGGGNFNGCSFGEKIKRARAAGATGVVANIGGNILANIIPGPSGGYLTIPAMGVQLDTFNRMAGYVPNRVLSGAAFPAANWEQSTTSNVTVKPNAIPVTCTTPAGQPPDSCNAATNNSPIELTVGPQTGLNTHGLATGDRVAVADVTGNSAANGTWTVTLSTATNKLTLDGSVGNGTWTGGGRVVQCPPAPAACSAGNKRTDFSRYRSVANATDHLARGRVARIFVTATAAAPAGATSVSVEPTARALMVGTPVRFANRVATTVVDQDPNAAGNQDVAVGATSIRVATLSQAVPSGTRGALALFYVTPGQPYRAGSFVELESRTDGSFRTAVEWLDATGAELGEAEIHSTGTVATQARTRREATVTPPAGAVWGSVKFEWTGATAAGTAFADTFYFVPVGMQATAKDDQGAWGSQRIIDFSQTPPTEIGSYQSPRAKVWPPPDNGIYAPRLARTFGDDLVFTTWMSDGLRVLDRRNPAAPKEVASFVPPAADDPSDTAGAGETNQAGGAPLFRGESWPGRTLVTGVDIKRDGPNSAIVAISDINAGLYILRATVRREAASQRQDRSQPPSTTRPRPRLALGVLPRRDRRLPLRFRARGRLIRPASVTLRSACRGRVAVTFRRGSRVVARRRVRLRRSAGRCRYTARQVFRKRRRIGRRTRRLRVRARFLGNTALRARSSRTVRIRVR